MINTLLYAIIVCSLFSITAGPLGSLMIWRRLTFLTDTLSHAALLGVAMALILDYPYFIGVIIIDIIVVCFISWKLHNPFEFVDVKLAMFSQLSLAGGLILFNFVPGISYNFNQFLFGDILAVTKNDILALFILACIIWFVIYKFYHSWIISWISEDLAVTYKINPLLNYFIVLMLLTLTISISIKILGALLITALMIIPAMTARLIARTPQQMIVYASLLGIVSSSLGLTSSFYYDIPTSAAITLSAFMIYLFFVIIKSNKA